MHALEAKAHERGWGVHVAGAPTQRHLVVQSGLLACTALVGPLMYIQSRDLLGSSIIFSVTGLLFAVIVWFAAKEEAYVVAREGLALRARGRETWLKWNEIQGVQTELGFIERRAGTVKLKVTAADGKTHAVNGVDHAIAQDILHHLDAPAEYAGP
jgi:membrane protein YdbS with pleckstrin-like domain